MAKKIPFNYTVINGAKTYGQMLTELNQSLLPHLESTLAELVIAYRVTRTDFYAISAKGVSVTPLYK